MRPALNIVNRIIHLITKNTGGYDVVDFRVGTLIGTFILFVIPVVNYFFNNIIPDYPFARNILIVIQISCILASYKFRFIQRWANETGNLFSLLYAFLVNTVAFLHNFDVKESAFALIATFALMGMFKVKKMMYYYTFISCSFLLILILVSTIDSDTKYFLLVTSFPLFGVGLYIFSLKLDTVQSLKEREAVLAQREAWFRNIFDNAPVGIVLFDAFHQPFKFNKYILDLLDYTEEELLNKGFLNLIHQDHISNANDFFKSTITDTPHHKEQRFFTKSGKMLWMRLKVANMALDDKIYSIIMFNDITLEKNIDLQLRESSKLLKAQNEALEEFSYVISHDLQEPLRMITSFSQIIKSRYINKLNDEQAHNDFAFVIDGAKRMSYLIRDMLEYSRWTSKAFPVEKVNTRSVLSEILQNLTFSLNQNQAQVLTGNLPEINANRLMLGQVFQNLIGNAIRYCHPDRKPIIEINIKKRTSDILFSVKDNGLGFEEKYKDRIFGIFQRLHTDKNGGTGMGLAICKRIIEKQGGKIWADSILNEGSTFYFSLPNYDIEDEIPIDNCDLNLHTSNAHNKSNLVKTDYTNNIEPVIASL